MASIREGAHGFWMRKDALRQNLPYHAIPFVVALDEMLSLPYASTADVLN
jgi:hypothetical protein